MSEAAGSEKSARNGDSSPFGGIRQWLAGLFKSRNGDSHLRETIEEIIVEIQENEDEIEAAMRAYYTDTHNIAEGAGAAPLAALMQERETMRGRKVGLILTGGNIDREIYLRVLGGEAGLQSSPD